MWFEEKERRMGRRIFTVLLSTLTVSTFSSVSLAEIDYITIYDGVRITRLVNPHTFANDLAQINDEGHVVIRGYTGT